MSDRDLLERIDGQIARNSEALDRNREAFDRNSGVIERVLTALDDFGEFMRELTQRHERSSRAMIRELERHGDRLDERHARQMARLDDLHDESRAQRQALLALIDEIRSGGLGRGPA